LISLPLVSAQTFIINAQMAQSKAGYRAAGLQAHANEVDGVAEQTQISRCAPVSQLINAEIPQPDRPLETRPAGAAEHPQQ
jgi:hypothetical protein